MRKVICAALRKTGKHGDKAHTHLVLGPRHFDWTMRQQIHVLCTHLYKPNDYFADAEQGFIDQYGEFMNRREALQVALDANQLIRKTFPENILFSEDLY